MKIDYSTVPVASMAIGMQRYIEQGIEPGAFLRALLRNDLKRAVTNADGPNARSLSQWVVWCYNNLPASSWGSADDYKYWISRLQIERDE